MRQTAGLHSSASFVTVFSCWAEWHRPNLSGFHLANSNRRLTPDICLMCFCYVDSWLHKCHSGWTSGGLVRDSGRGGSLRRWGCKAEVYNLCILCFNPPGVGGVQNITSPWYDGPLPPSSQPRATKACWWAARPPALCWPGPNCAGSCGRDGECHISGRLGRTSQKPSQTVGAVLTNAAIREVLKIYYQTYWYFRVQLT